MLLALFLGFGTHFLGFYMTLNNKVRKLREASGLSQEEMAEKMNVSKNSYGRLERGETTFTERKLEQISTIFQIDDWAKIKSCPEDKILFLLSQNTTVENGNLEQGDITNNHYYGKESLQNEIEKLQLQLTHKDEIIAQKDKEIARLERFLNVLEKDFSANH